MATTRSKFRCVGIDYGYGSAVQYRFTAITADEVPEHKRYHKYTPYGELKIGVDNPAVKFEVGGLYYLDIVPEAESAQQPES